MKTAITELFERYSHLLPDIEKEFLEKEKQQIIDAVSNGRNYKNEDGSQYYNETFKKD